MRCLMLLWWKKFWVDAKKYWQLIALGLGLVVTMLLLRTQRTNFADRLKEINDAHKDEVDRINTIRDTERKRYEENRVELEKKLTSIKRQYEKRIAELDVKTQQRAEQILKENESDPDRLAAKLSQVLGFEIETGG